MRSHAVLICMGVSIAALLLPDTDRVRTHIVFNQTNSVARGWYRIAHDVGADALRVGMIVLVRLPDGAAAFAAQRGYLPSGVPMLKRIGAVAPQWVCVREQTVRIDGAAVATVRSHDGMHRPLPIWAQCRGLADNELFLLSATSPASFDSRYFGPIEASTMLGIARPLWTWGTP